MASLRAIFVRGLFNYSLIQLFKIDSIQN